VPAVAAGVRVAAQGQPLLLKCKPVSSATSRVSVHKIRILSGMWNRPRSIRTRVSSTKNGILRSPERRQRAELTQSAAPTEAYRRPRPCRGPAKLRKSLALSDGSDKCATETELVGWGGSNHKEGQNVFFCRALVEYELSIYRQKYRLGRDASGGAGGGACARTEAPANSRKDRDNVATPNLTTIPFPRARRRLAVTRVTGIRAVLRHAAHGPLRARFPPIRHVEAVGATQVKRSPMELCKPAISLRLDSARSRHVVRFRAGPAGGLLDAAMPSLRAVPATTSSTVSSVYRV
jgi:hypothetical protein